MMEAVHATEEWQRAGVHYIRIQAMCVGFDIPLKYEFADDTKDSEYILVHENGFPVSTCRFPSCRGGSRTSRRSSPSSGWRKGCAPSSSPILSPPSSWAEPGIMPEWR